MKAMTRRARLPTQVNPFSQPSAFEVGRLGLGWSVRDQPDAQADDFLEHRR
jgi:hypothetical protein